MNSRWVLGVALSVLVIPLLLTAETPTDEDLYHANSTVTDVRASTVTDARAKKQSARRFGGPFFGEVPTTGSPHRSLRWTGPETCLRCHETEAREVHGSVMYQWQGETPYMVNLSGELQGKATGGVNSYCISILGNWNACGNCHVGLGAPPEAEPSHSEFANIDCLVCHQEAYRRKRVGNEIVPDEEAMLISMDQAARSVHSPTRATCLQCHARAGGGDAVKRGDLTLAHAHTTDRVFDVHMSTRGRDFSCQDCHTFTGHKVIGKGSDLRPSDVTERLECSDCHRREASGKGHSSEIDHHLARIACQTCHIPIYAKDASDTTATEATETHRTWLETHSTEPPIHPAITRRNDLEPVYAFWNGKSRNALLGDISTTDPDTRRVPTSRPIGSVKDRNSRLYPFKYKTALQPITNSSRQLIALDTSVYFATGDANAAVISGLENMGLNPNESYSWVETDTLQLLNHEVSPAGRALDCNNCHGSRAQMDLMDDLGYELKAPRATLCTTCHDDEEDDEDEDEDDDDEMDFEGVHEKHVEDKRLKCSNCHNFSRPERGLRDRDDDDDD